MKNRVYVAPCVAPKRSGEPLTGLLISSGLVITFGGVGTIEHASMATGVVVAIVGLALMYIGTHRIRRS